MGAKALDEPFFYIKKYIKNRAKTTGQWWIFENFRGYKKMPPRA